MELEKKYIYQVYQCGSFSKAAEALFITQPALSIAIKKVEQEIGAAIFNRSQRPHSHEHRRTVSAAYQKGNAAGAAAQAAN